MGSRSRRWVLVSFFSLFGQMCISDSRQFESMKRTTGFALVAATILVLVFVVGAPVVSASSPGGCYPCTIHYQMSLGCQFLGVGYMYVDGELHYGCNAASLFFGTAEPP
jgi:putative lipase involved disintegration of autophagic bodies